MKNKTGTKEWSEHSVNSQIGCRNDCRYCYMKQIYKRFNSHPTGIYSQEFTITPKIRKYTGVVMYPTAHDINERNYMRCFEVIQKILDAGNSVLVVSKMSSKVAKEFCKKFTPSKNLEIRVTITYNDQEIGDYFEPNAPTCKDRMGALKTLFKAGFKTSVSIEPALTVPELLVENVSPYCRGDIWVGLLNRYKINEHPIERATWLFTFARLKTIYNKLKDNPKVKFKDSFLKKWRKENEQAKI